MIVPAVPTHMLPHTCDIQRSTATADSRGGVIKTWSAIAQEVKCFRQPRAAAQSPASQSREGEIATDVVYTAPLTVTPRRHDRLIIGLDTLTILEAVNTGSLNQHWRLTCEAQR